MRKYPHLPHFTKRGTKWPVDRKGRPIVLPPRRAHGLLTDVAPTPRMIASAKKRAHLYMHAAARRRAS